MHKLHWIGLALVVAPLAFAGGACGGDDTGGAGGSANTGGSAGTGGSGTTGGAAGTGGGGAGTDASVGGAAGTGGGGTGGAAPGDAANDRRDAASTGGAAGADTGPATGGSAGVRNDAANDARDSAAPTDASNDVATAQNAVCMNGYVGGSAQQIGRGCTDLCNNWFAVCRNPDAAVIYDTNAYGPNQASCLAMCNQLTDVNVCCRADHSFNALNGVAPGTITHCGHVAGAADAGGGPCSSPTPLNGG